MAYNNDIHSFAPMPSGPLPTEAELRRIAARNRRRHIAQLVTSLRRVFKQ